MADKIDINRDELENYKQMHHNRMEDMLNQLYNVDRYLKEMDDYLYDEGLSGDFNFSYNSKKDKLNGLNDKLWTLSTNIVKIYDEAENLIDTPFKKGMEQFVERLSLINIDDYSVNSAGFVVQGEAWQTGVSINAPSTAYSTLTTKDKISFMDLMNSPLTRTMKQQQYAEFLEQNGQLDFQVNYETFINILYRRTEFDYETGRERVRNMITTGITVLCIGGAIIATGGAVLGLAVPSWIGTATVIGGGLLTAKDVARGITGIDVNGNPLTEKERKESIMYATADMAFIVAGFGINKVLAKQANIRFINNLDETEGIYQSSRYKNGEFRQGSAGHTYKGFAKPNGNIAGGHMEATLNSDVKVLKRIPNPPIKNQPYKSVQQNLVSGATNEPKNMFPKNWTVEQVNEAINQAYQSKNYTGMQNRWIGETDSGMEIMFYLDKEDKVISAFPVI